MSLPYSQHPVSPLPALTGLPSSGPLRITGTKQALEMSHLPQTQSYLGPTPNPFHPPHVGHHGSSRGKEDTAKARTQACCPTYATFLAHSEQGRLWLMMSSTPTHTASRPRGQRCWGIPPLTERHRCFLKCHSPA